MTPEHKLQKEVNALSELVNSVTEDQYRLAQRVDAISNRVQAVEGSVSALDTTVTGMRPMLETNTRLTKESASDICSIKDSMLKLTPCIDTILIIVKENQQRVAKRAIYAGWVRFWKSTAGLVTVLLSACIAIGGAIVTLGKYFFSHP